MTASGMRGIFHRQLSLVQVFTDMTTTTTTMLLVDSLRAKLFISVPKSASIQDVGRSNAY